MMYINGRLGYYGADFADEPYDIFALENGSKLINLKKGDIFKITEPYWRNTLGYDSLEKNAYFDYLSDSFGGQNIRCKQDGCYLISVSDGVITAMLKGDFCEEASIWALAGQLTYYPQNYWGRGLESIYLYMLPETEYKHGFSGARYHCYYTKAIYLDKKDQLKLGIITNSGEWVKSAGATLLEYFDDGSGATEDDFSFGDNVGGANIKVENSGKYQFYLYVLKDNPSRYHICWSRCK